ncbi:hypothetical protein GCM10018779_36100 [Streptomyces griseocarneus]|nr:hypothetical protein GCM10018779_36100 [Streptomyces griseocarneus]
MCSAERTLVRQRHHGMSLSGMPSMVVERRPRREDFSEPCTAIDRTFPPGPVTRRDPGTAVHLPVTGRSVVITRPFPDGRQARARFPGAGGTPGGRSLHDEATMPASL